MFGRQINPITYSWNPYPPTQTTQFESWRKNYAWTVFCWWVTVLVKDWHWRSFLGFNLKNWLSSLVFVAKYCRSEFLWKNGSLGDFYSLLVVDWVCYRFVTVKGIAYGAVYSLGFCGRPCSEMWQGKPSVRSYQVNHLDCIKCLNVRWKGSLCEIKSCGVVLSFFIK